MTSGLGGFRIQRFFGRQWIPVLRQFKAAAWCDFSYFLREGGTLDPLGDSRLFLHTWPMRKWLRLLSFRQWHGYRWFADEIAPRAVFPSSSAAVHQVRRHIPVVVQRLIPMVLVIMGIPLMLVH